MWSGWGGGGGGGVWSVFNAGLPPQAVAIFPVTKRLLDKRVHIVDFGKAGTVRGLVLTSSLDVITINPICLRLTASACRVADCWPLK